MVLELINTDVYVIISWIEHLQDRFVEKQCIEGVLESFSIKQHILFRIFI